MQGKSGAGKLFLHWLHARRAALCCLAAVFACFFAVYALYGHPWAVAGYAALLAAAVAGAFAVWDLACFAARHRALSRLTGRFPTGALPRPSGLTEEDYGRIIEALEAERARLEREDEAARRDAGEYYTLWAHQIKTPMAAMRLLLQSGAAGAQGPVKADLEQELFRIGQYVEMVLQYQRLSSMQNDLELWRFGLDALVRRAAKGCAPLFIYKKLAFQPGVIEGSIVTDEKWFCFVLEQLYTNAIKYTPAGGTVRVYTQGAGILAIEDSGIGIPPQDLPRVFERGFTGAAGRTERSSTGIGLYLCREVLGRLGFGISIRSQPGKGTTVLLQLDQQTQQAE